MHSFILLSGIAFPPGAKEPLAHQAKATCAVNYYGTRDITMAISPLFRKNSKVVFLASNLENAGPPFMSKSNRDRLLAPNATVEDIDDAVREYLQAAVIGLAAALARQADVRTLNPNAEGIIVTACYPGWCKTDMAGWKSPPLSAADGGRIVAQLALASGRKEHGQLVVEGKEIKTPCQL
ncbi:carbonyl reductase, putative [Eimeria praecox]|uniref:Carbonyl reductase, putative n=1 Tax=Eimeria praecox TaxID=51316 RepID=U6GYL2_9EIME|nr:carbonyl reductase, putative [Eimeria praecox]